MSEYQDVLTKLKSTAKPTTVGSKITRPQTESVKVRAGNEGEDTPNAGKKPTGVVRPGVGIRPTTARQPRSDSKDST